jgi:hypothetical protein
MLPPSSSTGSFDIHFCTVQQGLLLLLLALATQDIGFELFGSMSLRRSQGSSNSADGIAKAEQAPERRGERQIEIKGIES